CRTDDLTVAWPKLTEKGKIRYSESIGTSTAPCLAPAIIVNRADFQKLAEMRIKEAGILLAAGEVDGSYYLAGYGVEFALKACIIKMLQGSENWQEQGFSQRCWTHDL